MVESLNYIEKFLPYDLNIVNGTELNLLVVRKWTDSDPYFYCLNKIFKSDLLINIVNQYSDFNFCWYNLLFIIPTKINGFTCNFEISQNFNHCIIQQYCDLLCSFEFFIERPYNDDKKIEFDCNGVILDIIKIPKNTKYFKYVLNFPLKFSFEFCCYLISDIFPHQSNIKIIANGIFLDQKKRYSLKPFDPSEYKKNT